MNAELNNFLKLWCIQQRMLLNMKCLVTFKHQSTLRKKAAIYQVTAMLATSKNVLYPGHNHLLTTSADNLHVLALGR